MLLKDLQYSKETIEKLHDQLQQGVEIESATLKSQLASLKSDEVDSLQLLPCECA